MKKAVAIAVVGIAAAGAVVWAQLSRPTSPSSAVASPRASSQKPDPSGLPPQGRISRNQELVMTGTVTGRVLFQDGSPAPGFRVSARFQMHQTGAPGEGDAVTDANGRYTIQYLGKDRFLVGVDRGNQPYLVPNSVRVDLTKTTTASLPDFTLQLGPEVTVRVRDAETNQPVPGLVVSAAFPGGPGSPTPLSANGEAKFRVGMLEFDLTISDPNQHEGYGPAPGYSFSKRVSLKAVSPVDWEVLAYENWAQPRAAVFSGIVVDRRGNPVVAANVRLQRYNDNLQAISDRQGRFKFQTMRVSVHEDPLRGAAIMAEKRKARAFAVLSAAETWQPIRLVLGDEPNVLVRGRILDQHGRPLGNCRIHYWETFGTSVGSVQPSATHYAEADGSFTLENLHPGATYTFSFGSFYEGNKRAGVVKIPAQGVIRLSDKGLDLGTITVPRADASIAGVVRDESGRPVSKNILINVVGKTTDLPAYPDEAGRFKIEGVVDEPLRIRVFVGSERFYRTGDDSPDKLLDQTVRAGDQGIVLRVKMRLAK
jgi:hypothetical protein